MELSEDYKYAKQEIILTVELQYKLLSLLVTATAAVFVYILDKDENDLRQIGFCACLIIPGLYSFFGTLWLDQVFRQRRLAAYIYQIEEIESFDTDRRGWEHYVQGARLHSKPNLPSRGYYFICLGLFIFFPPVTFILSCVYRVGNVLSRSSELFVPAWVGIVLYSAFIIAACFYIRSILKLSYFFSRYIPAHAKKETASIY